MTGGHQTVVIMTEHPTNERRKARSAMSIGLPSLCASCTWGPMLAECWVAYCTAACQHTSIHSTQYFYKRQASRANNATPMKSNQSLKKEQQRKTKGNDKTT
jgi:hypothetical protein